MWIMKEQVRQAKRVLDATCVTEGYLENFSWLTPDEEAEACAAVDLALAKYRKLNYSRCLRVRYEKATRELEEAAKESEESPQGSIELRRYLAWLEVCKSVEQRGREMQGLPAIESEAD